MVQFLTEFKLKTKYKFSITFLCKFFDSPLAKMIENLCIMIITPATSFNPTHRATKCGFWGIRDILVVWKQKNTQL